MSGIGSVGAKVSEAVIAALVAHALEEMFDAAFSQTDAMLKEVYQKSNGIYDNLKKHMGEEFDDKSYPYPKTVSQKLWESYIEKIQPFLTEDISNGIQDGYHYYLREAKKTGEKDVEKILQSIPEDAFKGRSEEYIRHFKGGAKIGYDSLIMNEKAAKKRQEIFNKINEQKEVLSKEEAKYADDLFEIEFNKEALESLLNAKDEKSLKALEIDEEGLKGQIEAMDYIQKNILHYFESDPEPLFKDANERIKDMSESYKENYLKIFERYRISEKFRKPISGIDSTGLDAETVQSLMQFQEKLADSDIKGSTVALASFTGNIKELADSLTGEDAESIKTAVAQFGEFSGRMMNVIAAAQLKGDKTTSPVEGLVMPIAFSEDHAILIAKEVVAQLAGEVTTEIGEKDTKVVSNNEVAITSTMQNEDVANMTTVMKDEVANMSTLSIRNFEAMAAFFGSFTDVSGKLITAIGEHRKIIEPTSDGRAGDKITEGEIIVELITNRIDQLEETQGKKIDTFEDNFIKQFASLIDLIKKSSLTFDDIYMMLCKRMEFDLKYRS